MENFQVGEGEVEDFQEGEGEVVSSQLRVKIGQYFPSNHPNKN